jgi:hypothetical protein
MAGHLETVILEYRLDGARKTITGLNRYKSDGVGFLR